MILAGGRGDRLWPLTEEQAKPALAFGGGYRIIDFALSNCANSGLFRIAVLTQYQPLSLHHYIGDGQPWYLDRPPAYVAVLHPHQGRDGRSRWYQGTADAVYQNLDFVEQSGAQHILILCGDHVYKMNYSALLDFHQDAEADITVAVCEVPLEEAHRFGIITLNDANRVVDFHEKPARPKSSLVSMGVYVFTREALRQCLIEDALCTTSHDFGHDIIPNAFNRYRVFGYRFKGYWRDIGTIESYWAANMDLLSIPPAFDPGEPQMPVYTRSLPLPPTRIGPEAKVSGSLISPGSIINGRVERSVLSPGVYVAEGAYIKESVILYGCYIGPGAVVNRCVLDEEVWVEEGCYLGYGKEALPTGEGQSSSAGGSVSVVGRDVRLPRGFLLKSGYGISRYTDGITPLIPRRDIQALPQRAMTEDDRQAISL